MKIAFPTFSPGGLESTINPHFGKCETVTFVNVENGSIKDTNIVQPQGQHTCSLLPELFAQNGADMCVVGGIGGRPFMFLQQLGIKTYRVDQNVIELPIKELITQFLTKQFDELKDGSCNH